MHLDAAPDEIGAENVIDQTNKNDAPQGEPDGVNDVSGHEEEEHRRSKDERRAYAGDEPGDGGQHAPQDGARQAEEDEAERRRDALDDGNGDLSLHNCVHSKRQPVENVDIVGVPEGTDAQHALAYARPVFEEDVRCEEEYEELQNERKDARECLVDVFQEPGKALSHVGVEALRGTFGKRLRSGHVRVERGADGADGALSAYESAALRDRHVRLLGLSDRQKPDERKGRDQAQDAHKYRYERHKAAPLGHMLQEPVVQGVEGDGEDIGKRKRDKERLEYEEAEYGGSAKEPDKGVGLDLLEMHTGSI